MTFRLPGSSAVTIVLADLLAVGACQPANRATTGLVRAVQTEGRR